MTHYINTILLLTLVGYSRRRQLKNWRRHLRSLRALARFYCRVLAECVLCAIILAVMEVSKGSIRW
jgi:hypothetical protein